MYFISEHKSCCTNFEFLDLVMHIQEFNLFTNKLQQIRIKHPKTRQPLTFKNIEDRTLSMLSLRFLLHLNY